MAEDNIIFLSIPTSLDISPERIINAAKEANINPLLCLGLTSEGKFYCASSTSELGMLLILLEKAKGVIWNHLGLIEAPPNN